MLNFKYDKFNLHIAILMKKTTVINRTNPNSPEKRGEVSVAFSAASAPLRTPHFRPSFFFRRAVAGRTARLPRCFQNFLWRLASRTFKMSPNFIVEPLPIRKLRFLRGFWPRNLQWASHFWASELKVRLREAQSSATMVKLLYHCAELPIFCIAPSAQLPNFQKESDNFPRIARLCPKAITTKNL